jgi:hypothetical protein
MGPDYTAENLEEKRFFRAGSHDLYGKMSKIRA